MRSPDADLMILIRSELLLLGCLCVYKANNNSVDWDAVVLVYDYYYHVLFFFFSFLFLKKNLNDNMYKSVARRIKRNKS